MMRRLGRRGSWSRRPKRWKLSGEEAPMTRRLALTLSMALAAFANAGFGCSSGAGLATDGGGTAPDGGVGGGADAGVPDGARTAPDAEPPPGSSGEDFAGGPSAVGATDLEACYDGVDNGPTLNGLIDCQDVGCAGLASCCSGTGFACCDT